jgi:hypothetical protein
LPPALFGPPESGLLLTAEVERSVSVPCGWEVLGRESTQKLARFDPEDHGQPDESMEGRISVAPVDASIIRHIEPGQMSNCFLVEGERQTSFTQSAPQYS